MRRGKDIYPAHIRIDGKGHAVVDGGLLSGMDYDVLSQSSNCVFVWLPYTTGDNLPRGAVVTGFLSGIELTYSIRYVRVDVNADVYGPLTRYVKLLGAHAPGIPGKFSPAADVKENR